MASILFGYRSAPCFYEPSDFTSEFKITAKVTLILRIFNKELKKEFKHKVSLPEKVVSDLSKVLTKYQDRINAFPAVIENTSIMDGIYQQFTLPGKKIETTNIGRFDAEMLQLIKDNQSSWEYENALLQNELMEIITEIYPILKPCGMKVTDWGLFQCDWPPLEELACFARDLLRDYIDAPGFPRIYQER